MHLFVTTFAKAVWDTTKYLLGSCFKASNEWLDGEILDPQTGRWVRYVGRRGGFLWFFFFYCVIGPILVIEGIHWFVHVPVATGLGLERPSEAATIGLLYSAPIALGTAWYLLTTACRLIEHYRPLSRPDDALAAPITLYGLLTPDDVALTLVSRIPGFVVGLQMPVVLAIVLVGTVAELVAP